MKYFLSFFLIVPLVLFSQQPQASISKKVVEVGDRVDLIYRIELKKNDRFIFVSFLPNLQPKIQH